MAQRALDGDRDAPNRCPKSVDPPAERGGLLPPGSRMNRGDELFVAWFSANQDGIRRDLLRDVNRAPIAQWPIRFKVVRAGVDRHARCRTERAGHPTEKELGGRPRIGRRRCSRPVRRSRQSRAKSLGEAPRRPRSRRAREDAGSRRTVTARLMGAATVREGTESRSRVSGS